MELRSIYRTYRPQKWADVVGQEGIVRTLTNEIAHESLVHAYLFTGTRGVGKTTTARLLAKTVNCEKRKKGEVEPCNACKACTSITDGRSLDVMEVDAASHTGVDNVRENIIAASHVASLERKMKVFIIDEVHMLSTAAFNALLKTLEEPSANVLFILATTDIDKVPETIISRCQRFDFRRVTATDIKKRLAHIARSEGVDVQSEVLESIVRAGEGSIRDAESILGQLLGLGKKHITTEDAARMLPQGDSARAESFIVELLQHNTVPALKSIEDFIDCGGDTKVFLHDCIRVVRRMLVDTVNTNVSSDSIVQLMRHLLRARTDAEIVEPPELALELLIAEYAVPDGAKKSTSPVVEKKNAVPEEMQASITKPLRQPADGGVVTGQEKKEVQSIENESLSLVLVNERWSHVLTAAKKYNHSLALILKVATPVSVEARTLTLGFRYSFHADRLEDHTTKKLAHRIFEEVFAVPLVIRTAVVQHDAPSTNDVTEEKSEPSTLLSNLLTTFGGKVINKKTV
ncbi:MAG: DNA polymerase III subunit gamma/tau [bacterium]|nr:DNA polymerase III subunit gamma/tau [bacterium]